MLYIFSIFCTDRNRHGKYFCSISVLTLRPPPPTPLRRYEREWVAYRPDRALVLDTPEFDHATGKGKEEERAPGKGGHGDEDDLYERLGVSRKASDSEIRK
jgi:hypothetical protein